LRLARDPAALSVVKGKLAAHRDLYPLFNTKRFTRHLEEAFMQMQGRHDLGLPPQTFAIVPR